MGNTPYKGSTYFMDKVLELGIIGMGPAGIGMAESIKGTPLITETICFERGLSFEQSACNALISDMCCESDSCHIISGLGGASSNSSGKISDFPAGSGLRDFFSSEIELTSLTVNVISFLMKEIDLKKVDIKQEVINDTQNYYKSKGITYKHYDVYEFDGQKYRDYLSNSIGKLVNEGLQIELNTEVISIKYDQDMGLYKVATTKRDINREYYIKRIVLSTGAMFIQDQLIYNCLGPLKTSYEIGVRVEGRTEIFKDNLNTHGDLKLRYKNGRTYCVTKNGRVISYRIDGMHFLEGCIDCDSRSSYSNFAVVTKCDDEQAISDFISRYKLENNGLPLKQSYIDYMDGKETTDDVLSTVTTAQNGNIANLLPQKINSSMRDFLNMVLNKTMHLDVGQLVLIAPEIKILRDINLSKEFEVQPGLFIIGAASGKFRGILQSYCSGYRCGKNLLRR